jgi:bifunctional enzyme CysN/CysC
MHGDDPLVRHQSAAGGRDLLRFLTCGSVDDGKSTLIGRLLYDSELILDDQIRALVADSEKFGTVGDDLDFALLVDGLEAEREQRITIDVAYRYFATARRAFIVADTPGHEQYTRNMATGASTSDLAVLLVDARKGVLTQTCRHSTICSLFGIREVVRVVNKMDLVGFEQAVFERIRDDFAKFAATLNFRSVIAIPISSRFGDNVASRSRQTPWYSGPALLDYLETVDVQTDDATKPLRFSVQWVNRPNLDFRGYSGTVASGALRQGDRLCTADGKSFATVKRIVTADGDRAEARAGDAITMVIEENIDLARGDLLVRPDERPDVADQFVAHILWLDDQPLLPGRSYLMRIGAQWTPTTISMIKYRLDVNNFAKQAARTLSINEIGFCNLATQMPVAFDPFDQNRSTGAFILVDRATNQTAAAGMIAFQLRRAANLQPEKLSVDKQMRADLKHQKPCIVWFTGLPGSGKSTLGKMLEAKLHTAGHHTYMLDGDNIRHGLNRDLGFTDADRVENIRRVGEMARLFVDAGLIVICAFISPFQAERQIVRDRCGEGEFFEVFVDTPIEECMRRDPKGLYRKARSGQLRNFTGFDSPYERPIQPDLALNTVKHSAEELVEVVMARLRAAGRIG